MPHPKPAPVERTPLGEMLRLGFHHAMLAAMFRLPPINDDVPAPGPRRVWPVVVPMDRDER